MSMDIEPSSVNYNLLKLWPEFSRLWQRDFTSPEGLSAIFVSTLFIMAAIFFLLVIKNYISANRHLKFYRKLVAGLTVEQLLDKQRELLNKALVSKKYGQLWREFDESLVHIPHKSRLCNTLDAAHFFNTHSIARGLTENRLLAAVPGFLTAIGVIGTFAGLQLGLGPLGELDPANAKVTELTQGIFGMIGGASIAFMTSVWGVFISVLFNYFEKLFERSIRSSISTFQNEIDYLYPRITAEQSLSNIEDFTRQSKERLAELDEKIGNRLQEAMTQASSVISQSLTASLNDILAPAIKSLVDNAHSGSERALESLLDRFLEGVGSAGESQQTLMKEAANEMAAATSGLTSGLNAFAEKFDDQVAAMMKKNSEVLEEVDSKVQQRLESQLEQEEKRQTALSENIESLVSAVQMQIGQLADASAQALNGLQTRLSTQIDEQQARDQERQHLVTQQFNDFQAEQTRVTESIAEMLFLQEKQNNLLVTRLNTVVDNFANLIASNDAVSQSLTIVSAEMKAGANQMGLLSSNLKSSINAFGEQLSDAMSQAEQISQYQTESAQVFKQVVAQLEQAVSTIIQAASTLDGAAGKAEQGLTAVDKHFRELARTLELHLTGLEQQVADLLDDYGKRVQEQTVERLNTWNEQTNNYISAMTDAVRTLSSVVDEIDGKISPRN